MKKSYTHRGSTGTMMMGGQFKQTANQTDLVPGRSQSNSSKPAFVLQPPLNTTQQHFNN